MRKNTYLSIENKGFKGILSAILQRHKRNIIAP